MRGLAEVPEPGTDNGFIDPGLGMAPGIWEQVAGQVKKMPDEFLDTSVYGVTQPFLDYARPLIGPPLPRFDRLR